MKAVARYRYGTPDVLQVAELPDPVPNDNDLLIRVQCTTVNRTDLAVLTGKPWIMQFFTGLGRPASPIPGTDFAGTVVAAGQNVKEYQSGQRVMGFLDNGLASQAQYMSVDQNKPIITIPDHISFQKAVASLEGAYYAHNFIIQTGIKGKQKVMVNGATGAIGSAAVQFLKAMNCEVTATCAAEHQDTIRTLGADRLIDYNKQDFTKDAERYDFVLDTVGKSRFKDCQTILKPKGIYASSELGPGAENLWLPITTAISGGKKAVFPIPSNIKRSLDYIENLLRQKQFDPLIDRAYDMADVADAYRYVATGEKIGNVVVNYSESN